MVRRSHFLTELSTTLVDEKRNWHRLDHVFVYDSALLGRIIAVPNGFLTDFASVPRIVLAYLLFGGKAPRAAVVHDWLYSHGLNVSRETADAVFLEALEASEYGWFTRCGMWLGVRIGGWREFNKRNLPQPRHVIDAMEGP